MACEKYVQLQLNIIQLQFIALSNIGIFLFLIVFS